MLWVRGGQPGQEQHCLVFLPYEGAASFSQEAFKWRQIRDLCAHLMEGTVLKTENKVQGRTEK